MCGSWRSWLAVIASFALQTTGSTAAPEIRDAARLWGPYRPDVYVGVRSRIPNSPLFGLMWSQGDDQESIIGTLRHTCEVEEGMPGFGWTSYDPRAGGEHVVRDEQNHLDLHTSFQKSRHDDHSWSLRVTGKLRKGFENDQGTMIVFYLADESPDTIIECMAPPKEIQLDSSVVCQGNSPTFSGYRLKLLANQLQDKRSELPRIMSAKAVSAFAPHIKATFIEQLKSDARKDDTSAGLSMKSNIQYIHQKVRGDLEFDLVFTSNGSLRDIDSTSISQDIRTARLTFEKIFEDAFAPQMPFDGADYKEFSQALLANLLGGIGYFHSSNGPQSLTMEGEPSPRSPTQFPIELLSAVPSRSSLPRGVSWHEGFHLQLIMEWDLDLAMDILSSWFSQVDKEGKLASMPAQKDDVGNMISADIQNQDKIYPPTLYLAVDTFLDKLQNASNYHGVDSQLLKNSGAKGKELLTRLSPLMRRHGSSIREQLSLSFKNHPRPPHNFSLAGWYQWRGREGQYIATSGLDDYPRAEPLHPLDFHADAAAWIGAMHKTLLRLTKYTNENSLQDQYSDLAHAALSTLDLAHWSPEHQAYCDVTLTTADTFEHVCHKGYVSITPFALGLVGPAHAHLSAVLDMIEDPAHLWSAHGLRSLSISDPFHGKSANHWRGAVGVHFNYLVIRRLYDAGTTDTAHAQRDRARRLYNNLRRNLVATVYRSWTDISTAWEQYSDTTGKGQGMRDFTGWTALIAQIMAMPDLQIELELPGNTHEDAYDDDGGVGSGGVINSSSSSSSNNNNIPKPGSMYNYLYESDVTGWKFLLVVVTSVMLTACILFRRRFMVIWRRRPR